MLIHLSMRGSPKYRGDRRLEMGDLADPVAHDADHDDAHERQVTGYGESRSDKAPETAAGCGHWPWTDDTYKIISKPERVSAALLGDGEEVGPVSVLAVPERFAEINPILANYRLPGPEIMQRVLRRKKVGMREVRR